MGLTGIVADQKEPKSKEDHSPAQNLEELLEECVLPSPMEGKDERDAHDPHKPRKDEVGHRQAIPLAVAEEIVATSTVVDKDHDGQGESRAKGIHH